QPSKTPPLLIFSRWSKPELERNVDFLSAVKVINLNHKPGRVSNRRVVRVLKDGALQQGAFGNHPVNDALCSSDQCCPSIRAVVNFPNELVPGCSNPFHQVIPGPHPSDFLPASIHICS